MPDKTATVRVARGAFVGPDGRPIYGYAEVTAATLGALAVHRALPGDPRGWSVTHVASGATIGPLHAASKARAIANAKAAAALPFDWSRGWKETRDDLATRRDIVDAVRRIGFN